MPRCNFNKVVKQSHFGIGVLLKFSAIFRTSFSKNIYGGLPLCVLLTLLSLHYCDWISIGGLFVPDMSSRPQSFMLYSLLLSFRSSISGHYVLFSFIY